VKDPLGKPVKGVSVKIRATITTADNELEDFKFSGYQDTMTVMSRGDGIAYFICNIPDKVKEVEFTVSKTVAKSWLKLQRQLFNHLFRIIK